jgi:hypothetical protein
MGMAKEAKTHTDVLTFEYVFVYLLYLFFTVYSLPDLEGLTSPAARARVLASMTMRKESGA